MKQALRYLASRSPLFQRARVLSATAWLRGKAEVRVLGAPTSGRACGEAVARWVAGFQPDGGLPLIAAWRRGLLRPRCEGGLKDNARNARRAVELLAARPRAAVGETASEAARALLTAARAPATHRDVEGVMRGLVLLRDGGHLDNGSWRPAAVIERHPALRRLRRPVADDLRPSSETLRWGLSLCGIERPDQLSQAEANALHRHLWWARRKKRDAARAGANGSRSRVQPIPAPTRTAEPDELGFAAWVEAENARFEAVGLAHWSAEEAFDDYAAQAA